MDVTGVGCRDLSKFRLIQWITIQSFLPNHTVFHYTGTCWNKVGPFLLFITLTGKNLTYHRKRTLTSCKIPYFIVVQTSHLYFGYFFCWEFMETSLLLKHPCVLMTSSIPAWHLFSATAMSCWICGSSCTSRCLSVINTWIVEKVRKENQPVPWRS